ncbi:FAD-binding protein [Aliiruegeria haliotis]|nr:FAD-binding protein [Aliiruegeria haliotis]
MAPASEAELADLVAAASGPLVVRGGGTRPIGRPETGEALSVSAMTGVTLYEPGALTIVAQAGTPLAEVEAALAGEGQRLPFEPMDHRQLMGTEGEPTIGGVVAANVSGPRRIQAGACRDSLIGVRFVDGTGTVLKNGGRVMKNVTGYDLVKLMAGSFGTLGILSEVSFKVLPASETEATLVLHGLSVPAAVEAMSAGLGSPFEVSGAAHLPGPPARTLLRVEGFDASVRYRTGQLTTLLGRFGEVEHLADVDASRALWRSVRDVEPLVGKPGDLWRISVAPSDGPRVVERMTGAQAVLDWGGGLVWVCVSPGTDVRGAMAGIPGHATLVRPAVGTYGDTPVFHPEPGPLAAISAGLRDRFDPRGILNRGLMG